MSTNVTQPGPSRIKRKNSDPDLGHGDSKHIAEDRPITCDAKSQEQEDDNVTKLGDYLSSQYEVLLRVLSNLSAYDLRKAAQVSKSWQSAARVVRDSRQQYHWLFWRANSGGWNVPPPLAIYSSIREHVYSQPTVCVAFFTKTAIKSFDCSSSGIMCPMTRDNKRCGKLHPRESYMSLALGPKCELMSLTVSGIIGTSLDLKSTFEVENISKSKVQSMSAALFPDCPGVKIIKFSLKKQELLKFYRQETPEETSLANMLGLPRDMLIQAVILLSGYRVRSDELSLFVAHLQARQEHRFAVAGGVVEKADSIEGLVFLGDNVCAASLVINDTVTEKDVVIEHVSKIKNCNLPLDRSLCFMFTCLGRGYMWYDGEQDVESSIISKVFPKSPVVGFFGRGEIGLNFMPTFEAQDSTEFWQNFKTICNNGKASLESTPKVVKRSSEFSIDHSYSTCIMYLSFNTVHSSLPL